jgi:hypothetical protein
MLLPTQSGGAARAGAPVTPVTPVRPAAGVVFIGGSVEPTPGQRWVCDYAGDNPWGTPPYNPEGIDFGDVGFMGYPNDCRDLGLAPPWEGGGGGNGGGGGGNGGGGGGNGNGGGGGGGGGHERDDQCRGMLDDLAPGLGRDCYVPPPPLNFDGKDPWRRCVADCDRRKCRDAVDCIYGRGECDFSEGNCNRQAVTDYWVCYDACLSLRPAERVVSPGGRVMARR